MWGALSYALQNQTKYKTKSHKTQSFIFHECKISYYEQLLPIRFQISFSCLLTDLFPFAMIYVISPLNRCPHCHFLWRKRKKEKRKRKITSQPWKPDVTAFALTRQSAQRHSGTLSEMREELQGSCNPKGKFCCGWSYDSFEFTLQDTKCHFWL